MFLVVGILIYMYGYVEDRVNFLTNSNDWFNGIAKDHLFYGALVTFAVCNLILNIGLSMYKSSEGYSYKLSLFKTKELKEKLIMLFTYLIAGVNILLASILLYVTLFRINNDSDPLDYIYFPAFGILALTGILAAIIITLFKK